MKTIWVVEDGELVAMLVTNLLKACGYNAMTFGNGGPVIEQLQKGNLPDLLVLDLAMPSPNGEDVLRVVDKVGGPPVVMMTDHRGRVPDNLRTHIKGFLPKPFEMESLMYEIEKVFGKTDHPFKGVS